MVTCQPQNLTPELTTLPPARQYRRKSLPEIRRRRFRTEIICNRADEPTVEVTF